MKFNFSLSTKLFINNIFYAVPIIVLLALMFNTYDKDLIFAQKEMMGNDIQKSAMRLVHSLVQDRQYKISMDPLMEEVSTKMKDYKSDLLLDSSSLHERKRDQIEASALLNSYTQFKAGKVDAYKYLKDIRELVVHTGDTSNLILDPDLDSYYLMDFTLIAAPQMFDRLFELESFLKELSTSPGTNMSDDQKVKLAVTLSMLKESDWGRSYADIGTAVNEDKNFYGPNMSLQTEVKTSADALEARFQKFFTLLEQMAAGKKENINEALSMTANLINDLHSFYGLGNNTLTDLLKTRESAIVSARNKALATGVGAVLVALLVSVLTSLNFKNGTRRISNALALLLNAVKINAETSLKLNESADSLSAVSAQQAAAVQETVSSLHEINAMSDRNVDHIKLSSQKTLQGKDQALLGKNSIEQMALTIKDIANSNEHFLSEINSSNEELKLIIKIISDIANRTRVINDIVFQTRLLSFNASVEAARAGENGKGFAVVADEIGKLAAVSGESAREINEILTQATGQVEGIIFKMNKRVEDLSAKAKGHIDSGEKITSDCVRSLNEIVQNVSELNAMMSEIYAGITEQTKGYTEITKSIDQIDEGVHQGLDLSSHTSNHARVLNGQVEELVKIATTIEQEVLGAPKTS